MPLSREELARRLRDARTESGLTQQEVAEELGIPRTAVVQIEAGRRAVNSLELASMAELYGRSTDELFRREAGQDAVATFFRAAAELAENRGLRQALRRCSGLAREARSLERLLGRDERRERPPRYEVLPPGSKWDAIRQGRELAGQERRRLDLGSSPAWEIAEIVRAQGVRVTELPMPDEVSGIFFDGPEAGPVLVINESHPRTRRLLSYAHEYCHVLVDRAPGGTVSSARNRDELSEVRANAFAAHLLMPEAGVRAALAERGKLAAGRSVQRVYDGADEVRAQRPPRGGDDRIQVHDVLALAHRFGVGYEAALFHLRNLKLLSDGEFEGLRDQEGRARKLLRVMRVADWGEDTHWSLTTEIIALGLDAYRLGEISRKKLLELSERCGVDRTELEEVLAEAEDGPEEAVDAVLPA